MNAQTIYHNQALLGFAEVVDGDDLALLGSGGCLIRSLGLSEIITDQADSTGLLAFDVQEDGGSRFNFGVPNCGIFDLVQDNGGELCRCRTARKTIEFQTLNIFPVERALPFF